ncbi:hypothetical protein [Microbacterium sp. No. 7]|uniref:hypothetical protein n=1 Tax=Microbacterium sp. No. 7 TaxID=1714373 RepID=UPI0006ED3EB1|nr:hypothetical protein [Microbacterium sp. No. 7]ALJ22085.1 hypothetical protein AOA12_20205 [Microbacterium sp. No. 7]
MTDITLPESSERSRLHREAKPERVVDDLVTADDRIKVFWRRYPEGRLDTHVILINGQDVETLDTFTGNLHLAGGEVRYTVRASVYRSAYDVRPIATAEATRGTKDADEVTAAFPQETARTAALSAALRFAGINPPRRKAKP